MTSLWGGDPVTDDLSVGLAPHRGLPPPNSHFAHFLTFFPQNPRQSLRATRPGQPHPGVPPRATGGPAGRTGAYWCHWGLLVALGPAGGGPRCHGAPLPWRPSPRCPLLRAAVKQRRRSARLRPVARAGRGAALPWRPRCHGNRCHGQPRVTAAAGRGRCRKRGRPRPVCGSRDVIRRPVT